MTQISPNRDFPNKLELYQMLEEAEIQIKSGKLLDGKIVLKKLREKYIEPIRRIDK